MRVALARALLLLLGVAAVAGLIALLASSGDDRLEVDVDAVAESARQPPGPDSDDPLSFARADQRALVRRAALGTSHVIHAKSPGGVEATAERTARWRRQIERAAGEHDIDPDTLEAIVFLESAGRPDVMADGTPHSATGLTQITPSAATDLLAMRVDVERSAELTRKLHRASEHGRSAQARRLARMRERVDERFQPERALDGAARYLRIAADRFGSEELAVVSYHMGIGNLESVIAAYTGEETGAERTAELVDRHELSYARLFFDTAPDHNREAYELLSGFGDDSALYLWRVLASRSIMLAWREDPDELRRVDELATAKATLEELYHPEEETEVFAEPGDVEDARADGELAELPDDPTLGFRISADLGELASQVGTEPELYRALRPEALAALTYIAAKVQLLSGATRPLTVTSAVRDRTYQEALIGVNGEATRNYSLHTTGWAFDIRRSYASDAQASAFQFVLDRLKAHALIDYAVEPGAIHVTVSDDAAELVP